MATWPYAIAAAVTVLMMSAPLSAQTPKELKTKSGASVVMVNLVSAPPDCSVSPGPVAVPTVREKPANGIVQMLIVPTNVAASGNCPARKVPTIALIYTPNKDFTGIDLVQIEIEIGNRSTSLSYRIKVESKAEQPQKDQL